MTRFLYDGDALVAEYDGAGNLAERYVHGAGADAPLVWYHGADLAGLRFLHADERGSIVSIADAAGTALAINAYDEYGIPGALNQGRFQYTGQAWLPELGLYYYKARIYSPTLGRFLQTDPVGYADQFNLYAYVGDDPVNRGDPSGKDAIIYIMQDHSIQIDFPILFSGDAATQENINQLSHSVSDTFRGNFGDTRVTSRVIQLTPADVQAGAPVVNTMEISNNALTGGPNGGHSYIGPAGNQAHVTMKDQRGERFTDSIGRDGSASHGQYTGAHEVGHLGGLPDSSSNGSGIMERGNGRAFRRSDLEGMLHPNPGMGVRNMIYHCPPDCPDGGTKPVGGH